MKKKLMILGFFCSSMCLAQNSLMPKFQEGMVKTCKSEINTNIVSEQNEMGSQKIKVTSDTRYTVKSVKGDSAIVEAVVTLLNIQNAESSIEQMTDFDDMKAILNKPMLFSFNLDGTLRCLINKSEIKTYMKEYLKMLPIGIDLDDFANMMITDNAMLNLVDKAGMFSYYGKELKSNESDTEEINGVRVKRNFIVSSNGKNINIVYSSGMTNDEFKEIFLSQMRKGGRNDVADQIEQQWPMLKAMGYDKIDINGTANVSFAEDGWMSSSQSHIIIGMMGTKTEISTICTIQ